MKNNLFHHNTALLIIDMQNDFCQEEQIQAMAKKLDKFHKMIKQLHVLTIFTQFFSSKHTSPQNMQTFFIKKHGIFNPRCKEGSKGAELYHLKPTSTDIILLKYTYDSFSNTQLKDILRKNQINNVLITGVRTEICVDATAKRAFSEGFNVFLVEDLIATKLHNKNIHDIILQDANTHYAEVLSSQKVIELLDKN